MKNTKDVVVILAEDDDDDYLLTKKAFQESDFQGSLYRVKDGEELMVFLHKDSTNGAPIDGKKMYVLLLLDLNMPRKDGREALREIKSHPGLRQIPVVVLTTSMSETDITMAYELGANSFIVKPANFEQFVDFIKSLGKYWFKVAELPSPAGLQRIS